MNMHLWRVAKATCRQILDLNEDPLALKSYVNNLEGSQAYNKRETIAPTPDDRRVIITMIVTDGHGASKSKQLFYGKASEIADILEAFAKVSK